jgi:hypothetical protein
MPTKRISFTDFNRRLVLSGGREQVGDSALRIANGVAPESTTSVMSRWGSQQLYAINAIQLYYWNGHRYQYDGTKLYQDGMSMLTGFDGTYLNFLPMPPQPGLRDYLFISGGGLAPFKIAPSPPGGITNWGIVAPPNGMTGANLPNEQYVVDSFVGDVAGGVWATTACALADESTIVAVGGGSLRVNPSGSSTTPTPWAITQNLSHAYNYGSYASNYPSLGTDIIQIWVYINNFGGQNLAQSGTWIEVDFDVHDQSFKKDWYSFSWGLLNPGAPVPHVAHSTNVQLVAQVGQWQQLTVAKSQFQRNGTNLQFDWSMIQAIRIQGGVLVATGSYFYLDNLTLSGGSAMGAGPAAGNGGSEYDYQVVYRNLVTGNISNPNPDPMKVFGVSINKVLLQNIPVSSDNQVTARDLYRSTALNNSPGGAALFYLDTIYDNSTTTYTDDIADTSVPLTKTPWVASIAVPPTATHTSLNPYLIDAGNGYYFLLTTTGTTSATPPQWKVPTSSWSAVSTFLLNETVAPLAASGSFWQVTAAGVSGQSQPNWTGGSLTDGTVIWTNIGPQITIDNTARWTFQGINSTQVLDNTQVALDNAPPQSTYGWAEDIGASGGAQVLWTADSAQGAAGYVYSSPPGRPESIGAAYLVSGTDDPMQAIVTWDGVPWAFSTARIFQASGNYPAITFAQVDGALGTTVPRAIVPLQLVGIVYWAPDGIRVVNWAGSRLIGFQQLAPIFRGQGEENIATPWSNINPPLWAGHFRNEILFSDSVSLSLAISYDGNSEGTLAWRQPGPIFTAAYYEHQTGEIAASFGGSVYLYEHPGALIDGSTAISFTLQSPGNMPDVGQEFTTQRIYLTLNPAVNISAPQTLTPTLIIDGSTFALPTITGAGRTTFELTPKRFGRFFDGIRIDGTLTGRVEIFRLEADVWVGLEE